jgi:HEAT repeat protein
LLSVRRRGGFGVGAVDRSQLDAWLGRLGGPGFVDFDDRARAVAEMRAAGADAVLALLIPMLIDQDPDARCTACETVLLVDADRGVPLVLPLLRDPHQVVRVCACDCLGQFGDHRAVAPLVAVLQSDADPQARGSAALWLGRLGGPAVIPALLAAMANDHEADILGHTSSHCAAMALDEILGTEETRIRVGTVNRLPGKRPDLDRLRRLAEERYQRWSSGSV